MIGWSALNAALAVVFGAFGAHALKSRLAPELLAVWNTGAHYHLVHSVALVALATGHRLGLEFTARAWRILLTGIVVFSGSLYVLSLTGVRWVGAITPIGGTLLVVGWLFLAWDARSKAPE